MTAKKLLFSIGELSADEHAAQLANALKKLGHHLEMKGMGGRNMRSTGVQTIVDSETSASVMGFHEVLFSAKKIYGAFQKMKRLILDWKPDLLILIDYPDFNLRLAKVAHKAGVKVFYFITPQLWAWRSGRVKTIEKVVDQAAVIFPFERPFFENHGYNRSVYVGHPFVGQLKRLENPELEEASRQQFLCEHNLSPDNPVMAVFPGSRKSEIMRHAPLLIPAIRDLLEAHRDVQIIIPLASSVRSLVAEMFENERERIVLTTSGSVDVLRYADAGLLKSGTSNLQAAFYGLPFSMFFKASRLSEFIARRFLNIDKISIVNIIRDKSIREILQSEATPRNLMAEMESLLYDNQRRSEIKSNLMEVVEALENCDPLPIFEGCSNAIERTAKLALGMC